MPKIYAFSVKAPEHAGLLKVGYTIELVKPAVRPDGTSFTDHDVHRWLKNRDYVNTTHESFRCSVDAVKAAILAVRDRTDNVQDRTQNFAMRPSNGKRSRRTISWDRLFHDVAILRAVRFYTMMAAAYPSLLRHGPAPDSRFATKRLFLSRSMKLRKPIVGRFHELSTHFSDILRGQMGTKRI